MRHNKDLIKQIKVLQQVADASEDLLKSMESDNWFNESTEKIEWLQHLLDKYRTLADK